MSRKIEATAHHAHSTGQVCWAHVVILASEDSHSDERVADHSARIVEEEHRVWLLTRKKRTVTSATVETLQRTSKQAVLCIT